MIIKTNDEKTVTLYKETFDGGILTESQAVEQALNDMNNTYINVLGDNILGNELENYLKPEVYKRLEREYIETYIDESMESFKLSAYELLAEVIKVLSPEEVEKFARSARS